MQKKKTMYTHQNTWKLTDHSKKHPFVK
jgi:hypothetical protein